MYSGDEYYGEEVTSPFEMQRQVYADNSTSGYDADEPDTIALECPFCCAHIEFTGYNEIQISDGVFTLDEWDMASCPSCDATFGESNTLEIVEG